MKVCYFGTYEPEYSRNNTLINGLRRSGVEIIECQERFRGYKKFSRLVKSLKRKHKQISYYDIMIVGYPGQWIMPLARKIARGPIIFDAFISFYGKLQDEKNYKKRGYFGKKYLYRYIDRRGCLLADKVLLDTKAHIKYFVEQFDLPLDKFERIFVGTDERIFYPIKSRNPDGKFKVLFYAKFIPLHGGEYVVKAAKILEREKGVVFTLVGRGHGFEKCKNLAKKIRVKNIVWRDRVSYLELPNLISQHDISLGIFGGTEKAMLVIPNKVYEAMAMGKPFITGNSPAVRELLTDRENALFCQTASPDDLANKIIELKQNESLRQKISQKGRKLFEKKLNSLVLGAQVKNIIYQLKNKKSQQDERI